MEVAGAVVVLAFQTNDELCYFGDERNLNSACPIYSVNVILFYTMPLLIYYLV